MHSGCVRATPRLRFANIEDMIVDSCKPSRGAKFDTAKATGPEMDISSIRLAIVLATPTPGTMIA